MEAEIIALSEASREATWVLNLITELNVLINKVKIYEDNQSAICWVKNENNNARTKHIDIRNKYIQEFVIAKCAEIQYIPTDEMVADGMTKPLAETKFKRFIEKLNFVMGEY